MLVDTHILIWLFEANRGKMGNRTMELLTEGNAELTVSAASFLEIRLKHRKGQLLHIGIQQAVEIVRQRAIRTINLTTEHLLHIPGANLMAHADPFDLSLIAQAVSENLPLLTCDLKILEAQIPGLRTIDGRL